MAINTLKKTFSFVAAEFRFCLRRIFSNFTFPEKTRTEEKYPLAPNGSKGPGLKFSVEIVAEPGVFHPFTPSSSSRGSVFLTGLLFRPPDPDLPHACDLR